MPPIWTQEDYDQLDHAIDLLTGVFRNEKAARIRLKAYQLALERFSPSIVIRLVTGYLIQAQHMPLPSELVELAQQAQIASIQKPSLSETFPDKGIPHA